MKSAIKFMMWLFEDPATVLGLAFVLILLLSLYGCAAEQYWQQSPRPVRPGRPTLIAVETVPCGGYETVGCYNWAEHTIYVASRLSSGLRDCVISHEMAHARGMTHSLDGVFAWVCGDGSVYATGER